MIDGLLILAVTFLALLALNYVSIRAFKLPKQKRERLRKISLIIYVFFTVFLRLFNIIEENNTIFGWGQILIGVAFFFADKYDRKKKPIALSVAAPREHQSFRDISPRFCVR